MCRLAAWAGAPIALEDIVIRPSHSLLEQSQDATEAKLAVNGDGFGFAWYDAAGQGPGLYRDVLPAWSDGNLTSLCQMIRSPLFLAHVRASTVGETARVNCHPFRHGRWSFMHNGQIGGFLRIKRRLEGLLPDALYHARAGTTDSEMLFLLLLAHGLEQDPADAVARVLDLLRELRQPDESPHRITCVLSDGVSLYAFRYASDKKCPTLYQCRAKAGVILASEPLDGETSGWDPVPPLHLLRVSDRKSTLTPLVQTMVAA
ncbi:class II glutamine amidotransferase [uncultured Litoreibacter sp.]|uniref:class II glutamine amidotransferase n=1 Tax=uncultured Litoreibacter sp. TaxID=1392394 RepID=UPI00260852E3|nr:class II glutamine amidotransferase [uncultured Litoreibacter sp.]